MIDTTHMHHKSLIDYLPDMPLVVWMVLITLILGFAGHLDALQIIAMFNTGFGRAIGEFALILLPSFALAAALSQQNAAPAQRLAAIASPVAGAGMICPDTAYAALSPIAGRHKLEVGFGAYAGFKLLYPAGPLIVATGLGVEDSMIAIYGAALLIPVWAVGVLWARIIGNPLDEYQTPKEHSAGNLKALKAFAPFGVLAALLVTGAFFDLSSMPVLHFITLPKGALLVAALYAMLGVEPGKRRECLDSATRRTGSLLLVIGAASAFGAVFTTVVPVGSFFIIAGSGVMGIISLFTLTTAFKLVQGSSMATFAAVAPVAAPIVAAANLSPAAAVLTICLGSFIAILPNDSFYWLVRRDAFASLQGEGRSICILAGGGYIASADWVGIRYCCGNGWSVVSNLSLRDATPLDAADIAPD